MDNYARHQRNERVNASEKVNRNVRQGMVSNNNPPGRNNNLHQKNTNERTQRTVRTNNVHSKNRNSKK